ncbi:MAG: hypothetical protein QW314_06700 [Thermoproteota archaeon]
MSYTLKYTNTRGQIIIIISLFFTIVILTVAVLAYISLSKTQTLSYYPYKEVVESISTDFNNALTKILALTTQIYNQSAEIDSPRRNASQLFTFWYQAAQKTYSSKGLNLNTSFDVVKLQPSKNLWGVNLPALYVYNLTKLYWYTPQAISAIEASLYINSAQLQLYGWKTRALIFLNTTIQLPIKNDNTAVYFNLIVLSEKGPVNDLTNSNVMVWYFDPTVASGVFPWKRASVTLSYFGNGNYSVTFIPNFYNKNKQNSFWNYYYNFILVQVVDNRGIITEAYSYCGAEYTINENAIQWQYLASGVYKTYGTYLFELLPNGTLYWFDWPINSGLYSPPMPIIPVKQIRVYTTVNGPNSNFIEAPYQVELWKNDYSFPTPKFAEWRRRTLNGSKVVFLVNFPPNVRQQKVRLTWVYDCDSSPPSYKINMSASGPFVDISNGVYTLRLVANISFSNWIDYSISLIGNGYHAEYTLFGYDAYQMPNGYWFPDKITGGNWTVLVGPIRAIAFRNSTIVMEYPTKKVYTNELMHSMIISVPYNVTYFTWSFRGKWLKSVTLNNPYLTYIGMISGTNGDYGTSLRTKYGSLYSSTYNIVVNGSFSDYNNVNHRERGITVKGKTVDYSYGNWLAIYRKNFGTTIFASNELINALNAYSEDQAWIWTTADYQRRVMEYDAIYFGSNNPNKIGPSSFYVKAAGMLYEGGDCSNPYPHGSKVVIKQGPNVYDYQLWNYYYDDNIDNSVYLYGKSSGINAPLMYYKMFTGTSNPNISNVQVLYSLSP